MKKKVSIQTISEPWLLHNYGLFFQHYALRKTIKMFGFDVLRRPEKPLRSEIFRWMLPLVFLRDYLKYLLHRGPKPEYPIRGMLRNRHQFLREYQRLIGPLIEKKNDQEVYAYIAGGDCIWYAVAPYAYFLGEDYNPTAKRIAFGASSDWENVRTNTNWQGYIKQAGVTFTGVGVREEMGVEICQHLMPQQKVIRVVDPVFLLDKKHYLELASKEVVFNQPTLFYYVVNSRGADLNLEHIQQVAQTLGQAFRVVGIQGSERDIPRQYLMMPSPTEFLACLRDCDTFVTNSFHGIVFALIFKKKFVFLKQKHIEGYNKNRRQTELLTRLNLMSQALDKDASSDELLKALAHPLDWEKISAFLEKDVQFSLDWLKEKLQ